MKFYKLIKSIDYVTSPVHDELVTIRKEVTKTLKDTQTLIFSIIAGLLSNTTEFYDYVRCKLVSFVENQSILKFISSELFRFLCPIILIAFVYIFIKICFTIISYIRTCFGNNKDKKEKRDVLVDRFYHQVIPHLIEIKSLTEKASTLNAHDERKILLLYLQANHELNNLLCELNKMQVLERNATGLLNKDSVILVDRIGDVTYNLVLAEILDIIDVLFNHFYNCQYSNQLVNELSDLVCWVDDGKLFQNSNCKDIKENASKLHLKITKQYKQKCGKDTLCFSISS